MRRRIWSELCPHAALCEPHTLRLLAARGIDLLFAVEPHELDGSLAVIRACREAGVGAGVWPLLPKDRGRWASEQTAAEMAAFGETLLALLERERALPDELCIDLEPPFELLARPSWRGWWRHARRPRSPDAVPLLGGLARRARALGLRVTAAAMPMALFDRRGAWQALLGTPLAEVGAQAVTAMAYTSIFEGASRGRLDRQDAVALLDRFAAQACAAGAGISLGCVDTGAFGDEPIYRAPAELAQDVSVARSAGVDDLALFSLCGALRRPPAEAWLDAFVHPEAFAPLANGSGSRRVRAGVAVALVRAIGWLPANLWK